MTDFIDPARYTKPLDPREDGLPTHSDGYRLIELVHRYWRTEDGSLLVLDDWQQRILIRILETDAEGNLRFRQVLFSVGRQNGKSVLGAILALYGLTQMMRGANVIGLATSVEQANIIYNRVAHTINNTKPLRKKFKATGTRGIKAMAGTASYMCKPAKSDALQGIPVNLALLDEGHLLAPQLYDDIVNGQRAQDIALLVLITTAGDDNSSLLKRLYEDSDRHIADAGSKVGIFIYEGIEGADLDDVASIKQANPAIACGRINIATVLSDIKGQPAHSVIRYLHNRFVKSSNPFITLETWSKHKGSGITEHKNLVFGFDVAPGWAFATVTAARKRDDGVIETEVVASLNSPSLDQLKAIADHVHKQGYAYVMDTRNLRDLYAYIKDKQRTAYDLNNGGYLRATSLAYALISRGQVQHAGDAVLDMQMPYARTKNVAGGFRLVDDKHGIDAICATMWAIYAASTRKVKEAQIF